jgi:hypothetical protein
VLNALAASDRILEVNTKSPLVSAGLLGWWREAGGRAVSFGSDAHQPWRVGDKFKLAVDVVERRASGLAATGSTSGGLTLAHAAWMPRSCRLTRGRLR